MNEQRVGKTDDQYVDPGARGYSFSLFFLPDRPWVPAWISLVAFSFAGVGPLLLGQEAKAVLLFGVEWLVVFPLGFLSGALPVFLLLFHAAVALDHRAAAADGTEGAEMGVGLAAISRLST